MRRLCNVHHTLFDKAPYTKFAWGLIRLFAEATATTVASFSRAAGSLERGQDAVLAGLAGAGKDRLEDVGHKLQPGCKNCGMLAASVHQHICGWVARSLNPNLTQSH